MVCCCCCCRPDLFCIHTTAHWKEKKTPPKRDACIPGLEWNQPHHIYSLYYIEMGWIWTVNERRRAAVTKFVWEYSGLGEGVE